MKKHETLPLEALKPGMRVAVPVADEGGRILLPEGVELSENTLASLARREVSCVTVELEVEEDPVAQALRRQQATSRLDQLFRRAGDGVATRTLYDTILAYHLEPRP